MSISIIIPVTERLDDVESVYRDYKSQFETIGAEYDFIYVLDGPFPDAATAIRKLIAEDEPVALIQLAKWFGEATALTAGFEAARGETIVTLPAYLQVDSSVIPKLLESLGETDVAVATRRRVHDSGFKRLQGKIFNGIVSWLTGQTFHDLGCSVRALKRSVKDEINLYGDQHRFLPILAAQVGFHVQEIDAEQHPDDAARRWYGPGVYVRRALDIATVFFVTKFTKKPLRFFGLIGSSITAIGGLALLLLVAQRVFGDTALADRPALVLASLLVVLGIQLLAVGLIGELIIFTHARHLKEYQVDETINLDAD